jgi:serine/threonine protein kinase
MRDSTLYTLKVYKMNAKFDHVKLSNEQQIHDVQHNEAIVRIIETKKTSRSFYMLTELLNKTLSDYMVDKELQAKKTPLEMFRQIVGIVASFHEQKLVHADVNAYSVYLDSKLNPKISDFFYSTTESENRISNGVTTYLEPSLLSGEPPNHAKPSMASDVYALGVLLFQMLHKGNFPFNRSSVSDLKVLHTAGNYRVSKSVDMRLLYLVHACLRETVELRPRVEQMIAYLDKVATFEKPLLVNFKFTFSTKTSLPSTLASLVGKDMPELGQSSASVPPIQSVPEVPPKDTPAKVVQIENMQKLIKRLHKEIPPHFIFKVGCMRDNVSNCEEDGVRSRLMIPLICAICMVLSFAFGTVVESKIFARFKSKQEEESVEEINETSLSLRTI